MSDFRSDPNFPRSDMQGEMNQYDSRVQWAAVAVILLLLGGLIVAANWSGEGTQSASNTPAVTTGSGGAMGPAQMDTQPRPMRR